MASRAQVLNDYSLRGDLPRQRRPLRFQTNDPVVLPRSREWDISGGLLAAAAAATLLVAGATYAVYYTEPPRLAETPTAPLAREYQPDGDWGRVNAMKALSSPVVTAPTATESMSTPAEEPDRSFTSMGSSSTANGLSPSASMPDTGLSPQVGSEVIIDDSAPGAQERFPQPAENQPRSAPYPNPTTTPPDVIAPAPDSTLPGLDTENPYR